MGNATPLQVRKKLDDDYYIGLMAMLMDVVDMESDDRPLLTATHARELYHRTILNLLPYPMSTLDTFFAVREYHRTLAYNYDPTHDHPRYLLGLLNEIAPGDNDLARNIITAFKTSIPLTADSPKDFVIAIMRLSVDNTLSSIREVILTQWNQIKK